MGVVLSKIECEKFVDLDMTFETNKIIGIYDEDNSNLLEIISLLKPIKNGNIKIAAFNYDNKVKKVPKKIRKNIGYVSRFSESQFFNTTVKKELELSLNLLNDNCSIDDIIETMKMVDLDTELLNRDPFTLSSGEKRKLSLASILIYNPEILVIENPFVSLDFSSKKNMYKLLKRLKDNYNKTIIISSNDIEDIYKISDYIYLLKKYKVILKGDRSNIYKQKDILIKNNIYLPQLVKFSDYVLKEKNIKLGYRYEMNDLIKDVYRNAR